MTDEVKKPEELVEFVEGLKRRWMATVDALIDPLMIVGLDYEIVKANRALADLAASDVKSVLGRKCYEAFAGRPLNAGRARILEEEGLIRMDGTRLAVTEKGFPVLNAVIAELAA